TADRPVAWDGDLLAEEPFGGAKDRRVVARKPRVREPDHREGGVPHRGLAGLEPPASFVVDREPVKAFEARPHHGMVDWVAHQVQRHHRVDPGRLDASPTAVGLLAADDPLNGPPASLLAQPARRPPLVYLEGSVDPFELPLPRRQRVSGRPGQAAPDLVDAETDRAVGPEGP